MPITPETHPSLLEPLLDSWDRNNVILVNLLQAIPDELMEARALDDSPSIAQLFTHMFYVRLAFIAEVAPESAVPLPAHAEWEAEPDRARLVHMLEESAIVVRNAIERRLLAGRDLDLNYDHPILLLQHMIWHDGYHHGQIKLAVKRAGRPMDDEEIGQVTWDVWMKKGVQY